MGLFDKLISTLTGRESTASQPGPVTKHLKPSPPAPPPSPWVGFSISVTISGPAGPTVPVSDAEVAQAASRYAFVLTNELPLLKNADQ